MIGVEEQYLGVMDELLSADRKNGRNGMTNSIWGTTLKHDMRDGFPLLTTKKVFYHGAFVELLWVLRGRTDMAYLHDHGVKYWDLNYQQSGRTDGTLGPVYGKQMRDFGGGYDQLKELINGINVEPSSRRHLITLWNPEEVTIAALPPCWYTVQFNIQGEYMDILWNQRSADWMLGVPFDLAMMGLFLELIAKETNYTPRYVVGNFADTHLYKLHTDPAREQLERKDALFALPSLSLVRGVYLKDDKVIIPHPSEVTINEYNHHPAIYAELV